jgi:hypothetical protein
MRVAFVRRSGCVPNYLGSSPTLPIQSETRRAYWRVVMLRLGPRRPIVQFKSDKPPGFPLPDRCAIRRVPASGDILQRLAADRPTPLSEHTPLGGVVLLWDALFRSRLFAIPIVVRVGGRVSCNEVLRHDRLQIAIIIMAGDDLSGKAALFSEGRLFFCLGLRNY